MAVLDIGESSDFPSMGNKPRLCGIYRFVRGQVKVKRMWDPVRARICECHFCGKRIKHLHKYVCLEPSMDYIYLAHLECYALYIMTHNIPTDDTYSPAEIWGHPW